MSAPAYCVGIDGAKAQLDSAVRPGGERWAVASVFSAAPWPVVGNLGVCAKTRAEQSAAPDCLQRPLLRRSRFRQQVSASVGLLPFIR